MATIPDAKLLCISTGYAQVGALYAPDDRRRARAYCRGCVAADISASIPMTPTRRQSSRIFSMCAQAHPITVR